MRMVDVCLCERRGKGKVYKYSGVEDTGQEEKRKKKRNVEIPRGGYIVIFSGGYRFANTLYVDSPQASERT